MDRPIAGLICPQGHLVGIRDLRCGQCGATISGKRSSFWVDVLTGLVRCVAQELKFADALVFANHDRALVATNDQQIARNLKPGSDLVLAATLYGTVVMVGSELDVVNALLEGGKDETVVRLTCAVLAQLGQQVKMADLMSASSVTPLVLDFLLNKNPLAALQLSQRCFVDFPLDLKLSAPATAAWLRFEETVVQKSGYITGTLNFVEVLLAGLSR
jgi:hypothetical protein